VRIGLVSPGKSCWNMKLPTSLHPVPKFGMEAVLWDFSVMVLRI